MDASAERAHLGTRLAWTSGFDSRILCLAAYLLYAGSTLLWIDRDRTPLSWDPADHLVTALQFFRALREGPGAFFTEFFQRPHAYAPLYQLAVAGLLFFIPDPLQAAVILNLILLALLMALTCGIGRLTFGREEGYWAATLLPAFPLMAWLIHEAFLDFMLVVAVGFSLYTLVRAEGFKSRAWSALFGLSLGLGMLTKQTFVFFMWFSTVAAAWPILRSRERPRILNLMLALAIGALISSGWYLPHLQDTLAIFRVNRMDAIAFGHPPALSFLSVLAYPYFLLNYQLQVPFFLMFAAGCRYAWKQRRRQAMPLFLFMAGTYVAFTLLANKNQRYTAAILIPAAMLCACWLNARMPSVTMRLLRVGLVVWCAFSFLQTQWPPATGEGLYWGSADRRGLRIIVIGHNLLRFDHRPMPSGWPVLPIAGELLRAAERANRPVCVGVTSNSTFFNPSSFRYYAELAETARGDAPGLQIRYLIEPASLQLLDSCDYLVTRYSTSPPGEVTPSELTLRNQPDRLSGFDLWREYEVVDGSKALVLARGDAPGGRGP